MVRLKHRYLVVQILYSADNLQGNLAVPALLQFHKPTYPNVDAAQILRQVKAEVEYMYGDYGLGLVSSSLKINYFSPATSTIIIRVARAHFRMLWASLTWMKCLDNPTARKGKTGTAEPCVFRVIRTCGTIRKAEEEVMSRAKDDICKAQRAESDGLEQIVTLAHRS